MVFDFFKDTLKLALIGALIFFLLHRYLRWKNPLLAPMLVRHRLLIALVLGALLVGIKISEAALSGHSGPADTAILLFIHRHVPADWTSFFELVTLMGSFDFVISAVAVICVIFLFLKKWPQLALLLSSVICGGLVIYLLKLVTGRERPALWETRWYWGTSFPSGHTLETACFAMALTLCLRQGRPWPDRLLRLIALSWVVLVGFSRLVLGVHWPTDVLAAACIGMLIPLGMRALFAWYRMGQESRASHARV